jgi:hypothetical protein
MPEAAAPAGRPGGVAAVPEAPASAAHPGRIAGERERGDG